MMIRGGQSPESVGRLFNWLGVVAFLVLCLFIFWDSRRAKPAEIGA